MKNNYIRHEPYLIFHIAIYGKLVSNNDIFWVVKVVKGQKMVHKKRGGGG